MTWKAQDIEYYEGTNEKIEATADPALRMHEVMNALRALKDDDEMAIHGGYGNLEDEASAPMIIVQIGKNKFPFNMREARVLVAGMLSVITAEKNKDIIDLLKQLVLGIYKSATELEEQRTIQ